MLFCTGFLFQFLCAGLTGVMLAAAPFDWQLSDSYFVVAHFHYVLIGGLLFTVFAAFYYWFPKATGRMLSERLGKWHFWIFTLGFNLTFLPQHISGMLGMPRRIYTYDSGRGLELWNALSTIGVPFQILGVLLLVINIFWALRRGTPAGDDPWDAWTLEWSTTSPPPDYNFETIPTVRSAPSAVGSQASRRSRLEVRVSAVAAGAPVGHGANRGRVGMACMILAESACSPSSSPRTSSTSARA